MRARSILPLLGTCALALAWLTGCGSEIGRTACKGANQPFEGTITVPEGKPVAVWSEIDISYEGSKNLSYRIELFKDGESVYEGTCDPRDTNVTMNSVEKNVGSKRSLRQQGKMKCPEITDAGEYEVKAELVADEGISVSSCDLIFKQ